MNHDHTLQLGCEGDCVFWFFDSTATTGPYKNGAREKNCEFGVSVLIRFLVKLIFDAAWGEGSQHLHLSHDQALFLGEWESGRVGKKDPSIYMEVVTKPCSWEGRIPVFTFKFKS